MKKITIDHTKVLTTDQKDFPVLIVLTNPDLKPTSYGGHVAQNGGEDIFFTIPVGKTRLSHKITVYNPEKGELNAWVRIPFLSASKNTEIYLHYGNPEPDKKHTEPVWDEHYRLIEHRHEMSRAILRKECLNLTHEITVQAWVYSDTYQPEALRSLVSKWEPLTSFDTFDAYDASTTDGLDCVGYYGAVFDGRYVYWCPIRSNFDRTSVHAHVLRYDTQGDFKDSQSYTAYDAQNTAGLNTVCYYGAAFDGRYVIFVPRDDGKGYHSRVMRYDTHGDFKSSTSWDAHDANLPHSHQGAAFDGRYLYFCPGYDGTKLTGTINESTHSGKVLRLDTKSNFHDSSSYSVFDTKTISPETVCFDGGAFDGRYIYFVPLLNGVVLRYDTKGDFANWASWNSYDAESTGMKMNVGAVFDGRYLYFDAYGHSVIVRYDTHGDFTGDESWRSCDAGNTKGLDTGGFDGGFFDGRYVYFVPWTRQVKEGEDKSRYHTNFLRYDTAGQFDDPESWDAHDASETDNMVTVGYNAGAFDGRYFYTAPLYDGHGKRFHGKLLRYDTTGEQGSFSLRYCDYGHNGGLCAAVPGPSFIINTENGVVSIAAHKTLLPGWHHLSGVYNGSTVKLFADGVIVAERSGSGAIQTNDIMVEIGMLQKGTARFRGIIDEVRISNVARSDNWIKTEYLNLVNPDGFIRAGEEVVVK